MGMEASEFARLFLERTLRSLHEIQDDNTDYHRFPSLKPRSSVFARRMARLTNRILAPLRRRLPLNGHDAATLAAGVAPILTRADALAQVYTLLADAESRETLLSVLAFRALGSRHVKLARNNAAYWNAVKRAETELCVGRAVAPVPGHEAFLDDYDLSAAGYPLQLRLHLLNVLNTFLLEQYRYPQAQIEVAPGDVVIDGGGCWGDSALYFAQRAGVAGRVYCFEFVPANLAVLEQNLQRNPQQRPAVTVVQRALWDVAGETLDYAERGPGSSLVRIPETTARAATTTIDQLVQDERLSRVDFVKLDIEGAELRALKGAAETLRRHRPKLAIALYHELDDFGDIPRYLHSLGLGYEFFLDHFTIHQEETILFGRCVAR